MSYTISFTFDRPLTDDERKAVDRLSGETIRQATVPPGNGADRRPAAGKNAAAPETEDGRPAAGSPAAVPELTAADVRAAIERAKARCWGEGYRTDPAVTQEAKQPLLAKLREISRLYGAEKPSLLSGHTARSNFIRDCDAVSLIAGKPQCAAGADDDGDLPF